jgi:endonuclease/exonuclease/phosphatase (EEP) superfamily protein YafD
MLKSSSEEHPEQRKLVEEELRKSDLPTILTGDFNVSRHHTLVDQFAAAGFSTAQKEEITWLRMPFVLDHVFFNDAFRCVGHEVIPSTASDHLPLVVDLELDD